MRDEFCRFLSNIALALIISLIIALLFYYGLLTRIVVAVAFSVALALLSLGILSILSLSDNGFSRSHLNSNATSSLISVIRKYIVWAARFSYSAFKWEYFVGGACWFGNVFHDIKFVQFGNEFALCNEILIKYKKNCKN